MLKNIDFNKNRQRWKNYFCLFISFLFLIFFYVNRTTILENDPEFSSKFKIASIVLGWIVGVVLIFVRLDFGKKWNRVINILYILFAPCYIFFNMEIAVFNETYSFRGQHLSLLLFNFLLIGILELIFIVITNRVRLGTDIWAFICIMFNIVNHFVYEFRGTPAMASDIATVGTALEVADGYKIQFNFYTTVALVMLFDFIMLGRVIKCEPVFKKVSHRLCGIAVMAIVSVTGFSQLVMTDMVSNRGLYLSLFNPMRSYQQYGSIACFTRSIKLSVPEKPNGYSLKKVEEITSKYTSDTVDSNKKRPNVIVVINEAFSDPQVLGDIETNEDYMPFIHDLMKNGNCVSGTTYASIVGGQTANTEYEFLTGNSMAFLPKGTVAFQLYLRHAMPSLVTELKSEGYTGNSATHLQKARNYNRDKAYPLLGFDKFYDYTNMGVPFVKMRNNATDQCTYDNITHDYEQQRKLTDAPYFGYTMTIQNHSSYDVPFDNFDDKRIVVENADATDLGYYLSLIKYSDEMFENLINYYKQAYTIALNQVSVRLKDLPANMNESVSYIEKQLTVNNPSWVSVMIHRSIPEKLIALEELSKNLWWAWNEGARELFRMIDVDKWRACGHNPIMLLDSISLARYKELENDAGFVHKLEEVYAQFKAYMAAKEHMSGNGVAYFSMEYGLHTSLKIYSGGLGILAGDYLKEASDKGTKITAVGLLYRYGYFTQKLSAMGDQEAEYEAQDFMKIAVTPVRDKEGNWETISLVFPGRNVYARIWRVDVGRIELYLLDTDFEDNLPEDRSITHHLYGGDWENRLKQELLLGCGGIQALRKLGIEASTYHCNEGHAAFTGLERLKEYITEERLTFAEAIEVVRASSLFTTHTPVPAGHDAFSENMLRTYISHYADRLKISWEQLLGLGKINVADPNEKFSMSFLAANLAQEMNGVSWLHGEVSKEIFKGMWPGDRKSVV